LLAPQVNDAEIEAVLQQEQEFRKAREQTRQLGERALLDQAFKIENKCFEAEWAAKIQAVQDTCEQKQKIMEASNFANLYDTHAPANTSSDAFLSW